VGAIPISTPTDVSKMLRFDQLTVCRRLLTALVASGLMTAPLDLGSVFAAGG
jgi:hypothetical protein